MLRAPGLGELFQIRAYGSMIVLASLLLLAVLTPLLRRRGTSAAAGVDLCILFLLAYLPGAHALHALLGGTTPFLGGWPRAGFWGGQLVFLATAMGYLWARRESFGTLSDALAVAWAAATAPVKAGCFLAGCCGGRPAALPWGLAGHPVALYEAGVSLLLAAGLGAAYLRGALRGRLLLVWGLGYAGLKLGLEFLRAESPFLVVGPLSASMLVELAAFAGCTVLLARPGLWLRRGDGARPLPPPLGPPAPGAAFRWGLLLSLGAAGAGIALGSATSSSLGRAAYVALVAGAVFFIEGGSALERLGGLRLVDARGHAPTAARLVLRAVSACLAPLTLVGLIRPLLDSEGRSLPDVISGTRLIRPNAARPQG